MEKQLVFSKLVALAQSQVLEGRDVVIGAIVSLIEDYNLCSDRARALLLAGAVWKEATK
jgi:hypothetical protein